jgi:hypothetical protein
MDKATLNMEFLYDTYKQAKKQIRAGVEVIRHELIEIRDNAEACFDFFSLPVNNYLKDDSQIFKDFQGGSPAETTITRGLVISLNDVLASGTLGEENY